MQTVKVHIAPLLITGRMTTRIHFWLHLYIMAQTENHPYYKYVIFGVPKTSHFCHQQISLPKCADWPWEWWVWFDPGYDQKPPLLCPPSGPSCSAVLHLIIETIQPLHSALLNGDTRLAVLQQRSFLYSGDTKSIAMQRGEIEIATARCWCRSEVRFWWRLRSSVSLRTIGCF